MVGEFTEENNFTEGKRKKGSKSVMAFQKVAATFVTLHLFNTIPCPINWGCRIH